MPTDHIDRAAEVTTERVRSKFATVLDDTSGWKYDSEWGGDFDRWLKAHDAAVAARAAENALRDAQAIVKARTYHMARYDTPSPYMQALSDTWGLIANRLREVERGGGDDA